jgi:hypothetical protein
LKGYAAAGDLAKANAYANQAMLSSTYLGYQVYSIPQGQQLIGMDGKLNPNATLGYSDGTYYYTPDNWSDEIFENNLRQEYNLSISGATEKMNYYMSAGYLDDKGIVPNSGFQRYSARLKADYQVKPWLKMGGNVSFTHYDSREQDTEGGTSNANIFYASNIMGAIYPMYVRDAQGNIMVDNRGFLRYDYGKPGQDSNGSRNTIPNANPLASYMLDKMKYSGDVVSGKWSADIDIWNGIKAKVNIGVDVNNVRATEMVNPFYGQYSETSGVGGLISVSSERTFSVNQQYLLTYNKTFNDVHNVDILAGHESYDYKYQYLYGQREKLYDPNVPELGNGIMNQSNNSYSRNYATEGWLFRAQYDYDGRYFVSASFRRDASSCFHPDNRWGNFWSVCQQVKDMLKSNAVAITLPIGEEADFRGVVDLVKNQAIIWHDETQGATFNVESLALDAFLYSNHIVTIYLTSEEDNTLIQNLIKVHGYDEMPINILLYVAAKLKVDIFDIFEIGKDEHNRLTVKIINKELFK